MEWRTCERCGREWPVTNFVRWGDAPGVICRTCRNNANPSARERMRAEAARRERSELAGLPWPEVERRARALAERLVIGHRPYVADQLMDLVERAHECGVEDGRRAIGSD